MHNQLRVARCDPRGGPRGIRRGQIRMHRSEPAKAEHHRAKELEWWNNTTGLIGSIKRAVTHMPRHRTSLHQIPDDHALANRQPQRWSNPRSHSLHRQCAATQWRRQCCARPSVDASVKHEHGDAIEAVPDTCAELRQGLRMQPVGQLSPKTSRCRAQPDTPGVEVAP